MHNNYYFLRNLSHELESHLADSALIECFSQHKDELLIRFLKPNSTEFFIRADLDSSFCCLSFPKEYNRARKNSVNLFKEVEGARVEKIRQFENERSFSIEFRGGISLLFKMHGNRSNVIFVVNQKPTELFRNHLQADLDIELDKLDRSLNFDYETFAAHIEHLENYYVTFGPLAWRWLQTDNWSNSSTQEKWQSFQQFLELASSGKYFVCLVERALYLTLFEIEIVKSVHTSPIEAINEFYHQHIVGNSFEKEQHSLLRTLHNDIRHARNYISKNKLKLEQLAHDNHYQKWADLVMANMHRIAAGMESIDVEDLYEQSQVIHIPLNPRLSPQENAERYYRKGRNQKVEIQKLSESIQIKADSMSTLLEFKSKVEEAQNLKELRTLAGSIEKKTTAKSNIKPVPYHEFEFMNYKIWVGRNAEQNDQLTLKYTYKEDLWLHAKDVAGSHVVIKHQAGRQFPKEVIQRAAELAAFNSKRKTETLCAVIYTPKKYVRKRKGDPPGAVIVEKEKVILVEPRK